MRDLRPLPLTTVECLWLLRRLRDDRETLKQDCMTLENEIQSRHIHRNVQWRAINADIEVADGLIRKLWELCGPPRP